MTIAGPFALQPSYLALFMLVYTMHVCRCGEVAVWWVDYARMGGTRDRPLRAREKSLDCAADERPLNCLLGREKRSNLWDYGRRASANVGGREIDLGGDRAAELRSRRT